MDNATIVGDMKILQKDNARIKKDLYGENGHASEGMVTQMELIKTNLDTATTDRQVMKDDVSSIKKMGWALVFMVISLFIQQLWSIVINPITTTQVEQIVVVVTATPIP